MGFLTSSFINLILTREQNRLNAQLTSIMSRIRSAKKQSQTVEKNINNWLRTQQNMARASMQQSIFTNQANQLRGIGINVDPAALMNNPGLLSQSLFGLSASQQQMVSTNIQNANMMTQTSMQAYMANLEQEAELMKEMQLQPLNDLAEDLEVRKAQIEAELQLNKEWKDAAKEDTKNSVQNLKPNYGGNSA